MLRVPQPVDTPFLFVLEAASQFLLTEESLVMLKGNNFGWLCTTQQQSMSKSIPLHL
jgi:hypothetical protein